MRAAGAGRAAHEASAARQLANTARCLVELETDIPRARALIAEAETLMRAHARHDCELLWGLGLLRRWDGEIDEAAALIERALATARAAEDRWREYKCLTWLTLIEYERSRHDAVGENCRELRSVARKLGDCEGPFADALDALRQCASGVNAWSALDQACSSLRTVDDKSYLAYALNAAAALHLKGHRQNEAAAYAREAQSAGETVHRHSEAAIARALLLQIDSKMEGGSAAQEISSMCEKLRQPDRASARVRSALKAAAHVIGAITPAIVSMSVKHG